MNGVHDLGGMDGLGPIEVETNEPVFHQAWQGRIFGIIAALTLHRLYRTDSFRHAIERMDPTHYLTSPYYEHWLTGVATLLVENGVVTRAELEAKAGGRFPLAQPTHPGVPPAGSPSGPQPRFAVGDAVTVRNLHPFGHTRCPGYIRGKRGVVTRVDERSPLPDVAAHAAQRCEQFAYNVRFDGGELWGEHGGRATVVHVDLWESYLETP